MGGLLQEYGYAVVDDSHREQQFACDLHGPDNKPSARFYGISNSFFCFACGKSRDVIEFIRDKEQVGFKDAIEILEKRLNLPPLPWTDEIQEPTDTIESEIHRLENPQVTYEDEHRRLESFLQSLTDDRDMTAHHLLRFWEVLDRVHYHVQHEQWNQTKGMKALQQLREQVFMRLKEHD